jgi:uncharacterized membrane protein YfbV (UPF0208 family)
VASSQRLHQVEVEDEWVDVTGFVRPFYPNFAIFLLLGHKGSLIISFSYKEGPKGWWRGKHSIIPLPPLAIVAF